MIADAIESDCEFGNPMTFAISRGAWQRLVCYGNGLSLLAGNNETGKLGVQSFMFNSFANYVFDVMSCLQ